jgi:two-component system CheB/CheR fusion protein
MLVTETLGDGSGATILATDLDAGALALAREGVYDEARTLGMDAARRERFFVANGADLRVKQSLRSLVTFARHDLTRDPAPGHFDLIACRNVLIYFGDELQARLSSQFEEALSPGGILFLGRSENLQRHSQAFAPLARSMRIFERVGPASIASANEPSGSSADAAASEIDVVLVEEPDALVVCLDADLRVTVANPRAKKLIGRDILGENLLDIFPRWRASPVEKALDQATSGGRSLQLMGVPVSWGYIDLQLEPLHDDTRRLVLLGRASERSTPNLEMREDLSALNDELQSANEELAVSNEELQAANEELASLNEEFQSTNDSLASTNAGLEASLLASGAHAPAVILRTLIERAPDPMATCDAAGRLDLFNARAASLFGWSRATVGAPLRTALGMEDGIAAGWLKEASSAPIERATLVAKAPMRLRIEPLLGTNGAPLGWMLSWSAATHE